MQITHAYAMKFGNIKKQTYHTRLPGIQQQEHHHTIQQQATVIFVLKKSTESCLNQEEPHSIRGLNFFVTAITKHLNSSKISQFQILQINTNFSKLFKIYKIFTTNLFSKFATHLHQNFNPIYLFIYIYVSTTIHIPELKLV